MLGGGPWRSAPLRPGAPPRNPPEPRCSPTWATRKGRHSHNGRPGRPASVVNVPRARCLPDPAGGVTSAAAPQDLRRQASAFCAKRCQEIDRIDLGVRRPARPASATILRTRGRHQDALPQPFLAGPSVRRTSACTSRTSIPSASRARRICRVALLEQRYQQVLGTDVVMAVVAALLLGGTQYAPRSGAESLEHVSHVGLIQTGLRTIARRERAKYRGDWIRTSDLYVPNVALYQAEPRPDKTPDNSYH